MDGILIIDKPAGVTSHDVVAVIRRLTGERRVGHAGTLDPAATGVLPILIGRATKVSDYVMSGDKCYTGTIVFGSETDTLDGAGRVIREVDASGLTKTDVKRAAAALTGEYEQVPPIYSAIKRDGQPLYKAARRDSSTPAPPARCVLIKRFSIKAFRPGRIAETDFEVLCSKGTYMRSLARDIGQNVAVGAHLGSLRRLISGPFKIEEAVKLADLEHAGDALSVARCLRPLAEAMNGFPSVTVKDTAEFSIVNGHDLTDDMIDVGTGNTRASGPLTVLDHSGRVLAIYQTTNGVARPKSVVLEGRL